MIKGCCQLDLQHNTIGRNTVNDEDFTLHFDPCPIRIKFCFSFLTN